MRTETDVFYEIDSHIGSDRIYADTGLDSSGCAVVGFETVEGSNSSIVVLTKQQAAEFARQILEMCGEGEDGN